MPKDHKWTKKRYNLFKNNVLLSDFSGSQQSTRTTPWGRSGGKAALIN